VRRIAPPASPATGLWLEDSLDTGRAEEICSTYDIPHSLASSAGFAVDHVEVWAVCEGARNPWLAAGGEEEGGGATSDAHKVTRRKRARGQVSPGGAGETSTARHRRRHASSWRSRGAR